jgi:oligopeptide transport system substrate-binding protein
MGYIGEIFSGLVIFDQNVKLVPDTAEKWEISDDGTNYTFYLRKEARFHNGKKVTAGDFKYSMERACHLDTNSQTAETYLGDIVGAKQMLSGGAEHISGIEVIDDYTLKITIDAPKPYFLAKLTYPTSFVVDRQNVESGREWWRQPNGTGPFKLREWQEDEQLILERNDLYHREPAKVGYVVYRLWSGVPIRMYETGEIYMTIVSTANIEKVLDPANPLNKELTTVPQFNLQYIGFNHTKPPFDDAKVRQAFCHAIDKDRIIEVVLKGMPRRADGILPPGFPGYNEGIIGLSYDPQMAKDLIAESKYKDVSSLPQITLTTSGRGKVSQYITTLADMWRQNLGVEVQVRLLEPDVYYKKIMKEKDEIFTGGWGADYPDPHNFLDILFKSGSEQNDGEYSNTQIDALLEQARVEQDVTARMRLYQEIEQMLVDDAACLPITFGVMYVLVKPYVENLVITPMTMPIMQYVSIKPH